MKDDSQETQMTWLGRYALVSAAVIGLAVGGCTLTNPASESTANSTANSTADAPGEAPEMPSVRFPSLRLSRRSIVPIDSLMADREANKVAVSGTVTQRAAILAGWLYKVQDDTGSLWVLTDRSDPTVGAIATVEGIVRYESIVVGDIDAGSVYLEEQAYEEQSAQQERN